MIRSRSLLMVLTLSSAAPALAQHNAAAPAADPDKKICRAMGPTTGSLLGAKRECHTRAEWAQINQRNDENVDRFRSRPNGLNGAGGGL